MSLVCQPMWFLGIKSHEICCTGMPSTPLLLPSGLVGSVPWDNLSHFWPRLADGSETWLSEQDHLISLMQAKGFKISYVEAKSMIEILAKTPDTQVLANYLSQLLLDFASTQLILKLSGISKHQILRLTDRNFRNSVIWGIWFSLDAPVWSSCPETAQSAIR